MIAWVWDDFDWLKIHWLNQGTLTHNLMQSTRTSLSAMHRVTSTVQHVTSKADLTVMCVWGGGGRGPIPVTCKAGSTDWRWMMTGS